MVKVRAAEPRVEAVEGGRGRRVEHVGSVTAVAVRVLTGHRYVEGRPGEGGGGGGGGAV